MSHELIQLRKSRSKHKIGMEVPRGGSSCARCKYLVDRHYCSLAMWVNAPKRDGGGGGDPKLPLPADRWCCDGYEVKHRSQRNPLRDIDTFVSVQPDGSTKYYRLTPSGAWTQTMSEKNPVLFGVSGLDLVLMGLGVGVLGYIIYRVYESNYSSTAQGAEAWAVSGGGSSPTGMGQFVNQWPGLVGQATGSYAPLPGTDPYADTGAVAGTGGPTTPTDESANFCVGGQATGQPYCWVDQGNTSIPDDLVAVMAQPATGGDPIPIYGHVYGSTDSNGNIVVVDDSGNVRVYFQDPRVDLHTFPLSYLVVGLDLIGAAVGA